MVVSNVVLDFACGSSGCVLWLCVVFVVGCCVVFEVVCLWLCVCGCVFVVVCLWLCGCGCVFVVVCLWLCVCGCVFVEHLGLELAVEVRQGTLGVDDRG